MGAAGGIFGGISRNKAIRSMMDNINQRKRENQNWYDRRYNEDATQRADAQRILAMTEERIKNRNRQAAGTAAVMGGTNESVAVEKAANAQMMADVTSQIAANAERRKDQIESQYMDKDNAYDEAVAGLKGKRKSVFDIASDAMGGAASGLATSF